MTNADDLDIPFGGTAHEIVIMLADFFDRDPIPWMEQVMRGELHDCEDALLHDLLDIDLESSTQIPDIAEGIRLLLASGD